MLSASANALDHTLGRPRDRHAVAVLFWALVLLPGVLTGLVVHPVAGVALVPLQILAAILVGTAVARSAWCGPITLASMPLTAAAITWGAASLL